MCTTDHRPYAHGETVRTATIRNVLDTHGVTTVLAPDGTVLAWEEATLTAPDGTVSDASAWVLAPTTACALAEWLGY